MLGFDIGWQFCLAALIITIALIILSQKAPRYEKPVLYFVLISYVFIILGMTLLPIFISIRKLSLAEIMRYRPPFNIKPFSLIIPQFKNMMGGSWESARQFLGNILFFVPAGFLPPLAIKNMRKWYLAIPAGILFSVFIEVTQVTLHLLNLSWRTFDIDDIILNSAGVVLGYVIYRIIFNSKHFS